VSVLLAWMLWAPPVLPAASVLPPRYAPTCAGKHPRPVKMDARPATGLRWAKR
jgi:hypothetical protein